MSNHTQPTTETTTRHEEGAIIARRPYSAHPDDYYLEIVLRRFHGQYVTHSYNTEDDGYSLGHYHGQDFAAALEDFKTR